MDLEEAEKVLDELQQCEPEHLNKEALRLFKAIMTIANQRDEYLIQNLKAIRYMKHYIDVEPENEPVKCEFKEVIKILEGETDDEV